MNLSVFHSPLQITSLLYSERRSQACLEHINGFPSPLASRWVWLIKSIRRSSEGTRRLRLGYLLSMLPPCGSTMGWMYRLTKDHSFHETSLSLLSPKSSAYGFQKLLPLSSSVTTGGGDSTKLPLAPGHLYLWLLCIAHNLVVFFLNPLQVKQIEGAICFLLWL